MELTEFKKKALAIADIERRGSKFAFSLPTGTEMFKSNYNTDVANIHVLTKPAKIKTRDFSETGINSYRVERECKLKTATEEQRKAEKERLRYYWHNYGSLYMTWEQVWEQPEVKAAAIAWINKATPNYSVVKDKGTIVFTNNDTDEKLYCDLNAQTFTRSYKKGKDRQVRYPAQFFKYVVGRLLIQDIGATDCANFKTLVNLVADHYTLCRNFGTFLVRMFDHIHLESYIAAGVEFEFEIPFNYSDFDKPIRKKINESGLRYSNDVGSLFCSDKDTGRAVFDQIKNVPCFRNAVILLAHNIQPLNTLVNHYHYDLKTLFAYCRARNWNSNKPLPQWAWNRETELKARRVNPENTEEYVSMYNYDIVSYLRDYSRMALDVYGENYEKYPADLHAAHEECNRIYQTRKVEIDQKRFAETIDKSLEWKNKEFVIVYPENSDLIVEEGKTLRHCVGSYIQSVVRGECKILFLRKADELDKPFVTIEVQGGNIRQARAYANSTPPYDARMALKDFAKDRKLLYARG